MMVMNGSDPYVMIVNGHRQPSVRTGQLIAATAYFNFLFVLCFLQRMLNVQIFIDCSHMINFII